MSPSPFRAVDHVDFYGDQVTAVLVEVEGQQPVYVPVRPLCDYLGLTWPGQYERIKNHPVLSAGLRGVRVTLTPEGGRQRQEIW